MYDSNNVANSDADDDAKDDTDDTDDDANDGDNVWSGALSHSTKPNGCNDQQRSALGWNEGLLYYSSDHADDAEYSCKEGEGSGSMPSLSRVRRERSLSVADVSSAQAKEFLAAINKVASKVAEMQAETNARLGALEKQLRSATLPSMRAKHPTLVSVDGRVSPQAKA
jgi:hypothetical protein